MNPSPPTTGAPRQRPLPFPAMSGRIELWNSLTERQQQECRPALRQMLVAVVLHARNTLDDRRGSTDQGPEESTND